MALRLKPFLVYFLFFASVAAPAYTRTKSPNPNLPKVELHTHLRGMLHGRDLIQLGIDSKQTYPADLLRAAGIQGIPAGATEVLLSPELLKDGGFEKLAQVMTMPKDYEEGQDAFKRLEQAYNYRTPLSKFQPDNAEYYSKFLRRIAEDLKTQKVGYAEISAPKEIVSAEWLKNAEKALPAIEAETGVRLRFLLGIRRTAPVGEMLESIDGLRETLPRNPFVLGVDFMGEEVNPTRDFAPAIRAAAELDDVRDDMVVRVHAGEADPRVRPDLANNVEDAIDAGATRIGHGVHGITEKTARKAAAKNVEIEINVTSNEKLGYVDATRRPPVEMYSRQNVGMTFNTDGHGLFETTVPEEMKRYGDLTNGRAVENLGVLALPADAKRIRGAFRDYHVDKLQVVVDPSDIPPGETFDSVKQRVLSDLGPNYAARTEVLREPPDGMAAHLNRMSRQSDRLVMAIVNDELPKTQFISERAVRSSLQAVPVSRPGEGSCAYRWESWALTLRTAQ